MIYRIEKETHQLRAYLLSIVLILLIRKILILIFSV